MKSFTKMGPVLLLLMTGFAGTPRAQDTDHPGLEWFLEAPAAELAVHYHKMNYALSVVKLVERGASFQWGDRVITPDNVQAFNAGLKQGYADAETAMLKRGSASIAGFYTLEASKHCGSIPSVWTQGIRQNELTTVEIRQDKFNLKLIHLFGREGKTDTLEIAGVIVESSFTFDDPLNSDFGFTGVSSPGEIVVRPNGKAILDAWPSFGGFNPPPKRRDLNKCRVRFISDRKG